MTKEFRSKIESAHAEELNDKKNYEAMANDCENCHIAGILRDIAHDEGTHAEALNHILEMEG